MTNKAIPVEKVPAPRAGASHVWEFAPEAESRDETWVRKVKSTPVSSLGGRIVTTHVSLSNGAELPAMLSNIDLNDKTCTDHFLDLSVFVDGGWIHLARYHDVDVSNRGPAALAKSLGLSIAEVFPIEYDISKVAKGRADCVRGLIAAEPAVRLSEAALIKMAVRGTL